MKRLIIPLVILLLAAVLMSGCGQAATPAPTTTAPVPATTTPATTTAPATTPASKFGGTLRVIETAAPGAPIGAEWEGNLGTYNTQQWVLERLLKEKIDGTMQAELAERWEVTSTGTTPNIVFYLRKGVKFHDGTDFNAAAVAWNLDMFKKTGMFTATTNFWKSWDILDEHTIRMNYTTWRNTSLRSWENYFMVSPSAFEKKGIEWVRVNMVGTGPFMQTDYQKDVSLTAVRNPNYWQKDAQGNQLPYLDKVILLYVADETTRELMWKKGEAEMLNSSTKQAVRLQSTEWTTLTRPGGPTILAPDSGNAGSPFANKNIRLAVEYAIDRESLAKNTGYGYDKPAYQMATSQAKAYDPSLPPRNFDLEKAKQLMKDGGYPNGFKTTIFVGPGVNRDPVIIIQAALAKIGIEVEMQFPEPAAWQAVTTQPAKVNSMVYIPLNEWSNFNTTLNVFFSGLGFYLPSNKKPEGYVDMFNASLNAPGPDPALLRTITKAFYDDCTIIPLVYSTFVFMLRPNIMDSGLTLQGTQNAWDYARIWIKK
ncbi:MAG TPA: ABC transporter substrate-binding protein [Dehalococcoidales bacterium]|nr:ABC transporter substrate-binding protein [Dehalococcoidales bacterium]